MSSTAYKRDLVKKYVSSKSTDLRDQVIEEYYYLVERLSEKISRRIKNKITKEELCSYGIVGLWKALERYDPDKANFITFAYCKIFGAILDGIRDLDEVPKFVRQRVKELEKLKKEIEDAEKREVPIQELIQRAGYSLKKYEKYPQLFVPSKNFSLNSKDNKDEFDAIFENNSFDRSICDPEARMQKKESFERILKFCTKKERKIVVYKYVHDLSFKEIAKKIKTTEDKVSSIHKKTLQKLAESIEK
jgi:RNA polymerase sigma factor for flagellar operon FliA